MSRAVLLLRRAGAQRALLGLVGLLVAVAAAALCATFGVVRAGADTVPPAAQPAVVAGAGVPVALLALAALVTFAQVGRLLAQERQAETELLVSRGAAPAHVTTAAVTEAVPVCVAGAALGAAAGAAALAAAGIRADAGILAVVGAAVAAAAIAVLVGTVALRARAAARRTVVDRSGRARQVATGGVVALTVAAAAVCLAQLLRYGSPVVVAADGATRTDPLAAAAPALVLASLVVVALGVLGPAARLVERSAARRPGLAVVTVRQVARRLVSYAVPLVLLVLAGGSAAFAGVYAGSAARMGSDVGLLTAGADVRVVRENPPALNQGASRDAAVAAGVPGVAAAAPAMRLEGSVQSLTPTVLAVPAAAIADVVRTPRRADAQTLATGVAGGDVPFADAPQIPAGAAAFEARITASASVISSPDAAGEPEAAAAESDRAAAGFPAVTLWLARDDGSMAPVPLGGFDADLRGDGGGTRPVGARPTAYTVHVDLPEPLAAGWRLAAVDVAIAGTATSQLHLALAIGALAAQVDGRSEPVDLTAPWMPGLGDTGVVRQATSGLAIDLLTVDGGQHRLRLQPLGQGQAVLPAVLTRSLARDLGLTVGDSVDLSSQGMRIPLHVDGVVDVVPGALTPHAVLVDLGRLSALLLHLRGQVAAPGEVWASVRDGAVGVPDAVAAALPGTTVLTPQTAAPRADASGPVRDATWIAAVGVVVLALLGVGMTAVAGLHARRGEVVVLRAVGVGPREQGTARAVELSAVGVAAALLGLAGGWALGVVVTSGLVRSTVTGVALVPPSTLAWAGPATAVLAVALAVGVLAVAVAVGGRVRAQARDTAFREEVR